MNYYFAKTLHCSFDEAVERVTTALKEAGFGIITEIDVKETFKKKLGIDFRNYRILGACNPATAREAIEIEDKVGTMLPCNVVAQELGMARSRLPLLIRWHRWQRSKTKSCAAPHKRFATC